MIGLLERLRRRPPRPFAHDTDWHGELDAIRDELTRRRTRRAITQPDPQANRGQNRT